MKLRSATWVIGGFAVAGAAAILLDALFLEKYFFEVKTYDIGKKNNGEKLKLVLLADLHFKETLKPYHYKLASKLNMLQPELILFAGDTIDSTGKTEPLKEFFSLLDQHVIKVAIPGNNDHKAQTSLNNLQRIFEEHKGHFLINNSVALMIGGKRITITGLDDFIEGKSCFQAAVENVAREEHHFLLIHSPLQQESVIKEVEAINKTRTASEQLNIRYIFAGHNHGGQIRLPGYVPKLPGMSGNYINGWYNKEPPYLYLSRGFGTTSIPLRFFARSEVTVFNYYL
ncbi:metallophosphoesterase [Pontibacter harenae]|uniref:metallophosphoesterase n=1 Tax=Pontibacter harenae TaxID=2894083 RepID=UPI001E4C5310|nr:metallophosphoesterase [Pontibacter harenae]MCC9167122.1 metallophosphoesterase [Pontibacter harenae]